MSLSEPIFIVGAPRSGNTLARRVLLASGQVYIPPETYVLGEVIERWPAWNKLQWREKVWLLAAYFEHHRNWSEMDIETLEPFATAAAEWPAARQGLRSLLDALYAYFAAEHGFTQDRWGDKTPWNTMYLKPMSKLFPAAKYVYLVRDGRDSVASQVRADMRTVEDAVERWIQANWACGKHLAAGNTLKVRYEDLVSDPVTVFKDIFSFAGMTFDADYLTRIPENLGDIEMLDHHAKVLKPITPASIGNWEKTLSYEQIAGFASGFHKQMARLGYAQER